MKLAALLPLLPLLTSAYQLSTTERDLARLVTSDDVCAICHTASDIVNKEVQLGGQVWNLVRDGVLDQCQKVPIDLVQSECNYIMGQLDTVATAIEHALEGEDVCKRLHICPSVNVLASPQLSGPLCDDCELVNDFVKTAIDEGAQFWDTSRPKLMTACGEIPVESIASACKVGVGEVDQVVSSLEKQLGDLDICSKIGCNDTSIAQDGLPEQICDVCDDVDDQLDDALEKIDDLWLKHVAAFEGLCAKIDDEKSAAACTSAVKRVDAKVETFIKTLEDFDVCPMVGCDDDVKSPLGAFVQLSQADDMPEQLCDACESASDLVEEALKQAEQKWDVARDQLKAECEKIPQEQLSATCDQVVAQLDKYAAAIEKGLSGVDVCKSIGCSDPDMVTKQLLMLAYTKPTNSDACSICTAAADIVKKQVALGESIWDTVRESVNTFCQHIPQDQLEQGCEAVVSTLDDIAKFVEQELDTTGVCKKMGFCPSQSVESRLRGVAVEA